MLPALSPKDKVLTLNWFINPKAGELVVAKVRGREIIKRVAKLKKDQLFLKGDNEIESTDSRTYGWINKSALLGKVIYILKAS